MVQRLDNPNMIPTSQHAGNTTADNTAAMTAPGSPSQSVPEDMIAPVPELVASGPEIPVSTQNQPGGENVTPVRWNLVANAGVETR